MKALILLVAVVCVGCASGTQEGTQAPSQPESAGTTAEARKVRVLETPDNIRFGVLGDAAAGPAPTLFVIGGQLEATLNRIDEKNWNQVLRVVDHGVLCVTLDAPCHGQERKPGEPQGLWGWRHRLERGDNPFPGHIANLSAVLDYLVDQKMADPDLSLIHI